MLSGKSYDVVILGAGIAGLSLASQLSKTNKVLILERENDIPSNKYWLTNSKCLKNNSELITSIDSKYSLMDIVAYEGTKRRIKGKYILWDTQKLIDHFLQEIINNKANIVLNSTFYSLKYNNNGVYVFANDQRFHTRLIIDCMGYSSPIIQSKSTLRIIGYYHLSGISIKLKKNIVPIAFANIMLEKHAKYIEIFPTSTQLAHVTIISPSKTIISNMKMKDDLNFIIKDSILKSYFENNSYNSYLGGIVPIGHVKKKALNRILFYGESGQINPAATATGFTRILLTYKNLAKEINDKLILNDLTKKSLENIKTSFMSKFNRNLQIYVFKEMLEWNSDNFLALVKQLESLNDEEINMILFGELELRDVISSKKIINLIKSKNWILLRNSLKAILTRYL